MRFGHYRIRRARIGEGPAIRAMQEFSLRVLGADHYRPDEIAAFLEQIGTMDYAVLAEGHFFVAVDLRGAILASGGWSRLKPGYASASVSGSAPVAPRRDCATVRSVFVAPSAVRRGIATAIMRHTENDAAINGVRRLKLTATLSGVGLYEALGYGRGTNRSVDLGDGIGFGCLDMEKAVMVQAAAA